MFSEVVLAHRRRLGLSQEELASKAGVSVRTVRGLEAGGVAVPQPVTVRLLADAFGLHGGERDRFCAAASAEAIGAGTLPSGALGRPPGRAIAPAQLPADVPTFAGRAGHLRRLTALLDDGGRTTTVVICAISGTAGVGKTTLAVHWAHQVRGRFPDGQLYVNLRGFDPSGSVVDPSDAVRAFLDALDVPPQRIPAGLDAQAGLYRSLLADRRMLIVLDNARDAGQVRPLLPGSSGCLVVITSRDHLAGLVAAESASPLTLDLMDHDDAWQMLVRRLGEDRLDAEPAAVRDIITSCAGLPLALALVAARAATRPHFPLAALAQQLRDAGGGLDAFTGEEVVTDVRAVFSWSYRSLGANAARLFRLVGLHPGPDISAPAAASLAGLPPAQAGPLLAKLTRDHLLTEHTPGRYTLHELLRAYAREQAEAHESDPQRRAAIHRVLDHYLLTAIPAAGLLNPYRQPTPPPPTAAAVRPEPLVDDRQAMAWFTVEHDVLMAVVENAAGFDVHAWQLASALGTFCQRRGHWRDQITIQTVALEAARRLADRNRQAAAHRELGRAYLRLGHDDAFTHFEQALRLWQALGDRGGEASAHNQLAEVLDRWGRPGDALAHTRQALQLYRAVGYETGQAWALNGIGWLHARLGHHQEAVSYCEQALALQRGIDDRLGQVATLDSLGYAHHLLDHHTQAIACYRHALDTCRDLGDRYYEATVLVHLGDAHHTVGDLAASRAAWQQAVEILRQLDHPDADAVHTKLQELHGPAHRH